MRRREGRGARERQNSLGERGKERGSDYTGVSVDYLPELLLVSCGEFPHLLLPTLFLFSEHGLHLLNLSVVGGTHV